MNYRIAYRWPMNHNHIPRVITVDKNPAYPPAIAELKNDKILPKNVGIRRIKYLNNIIEQDHRSIKRIVNPMSVIPVLVNTIFI